MTSSVFDRGSGGAGVGGGGVSPIDGQFLVGNGTTWVGESGATARASMGLSLLEAAIAIPADGTFLVGDGATWVLESGATARTSLGLVAGGAGDIWVEKAGDTMTGNLSMDNATGPAMLNEASSSTNPVFCPDKGDLTLGIGSGTNIGYFIAAGTEIARWNTSGLRSANGAGFQLHNEAATATNPTISPNWNDIDTGIGWTSANRGAFVANGALIAEFTAGAAGTEQFIIPLNNAAATPGLAFGDGDTGFYQSVDNVIDVSLAGSLIWRFAPTTLGATGGIRALMQWGTMSRTVPGFACAIDPDSGLSVGYVIDNVSLVTGGVEAARFGEMNGELLTAFLPTTESTVSDATTAAAAATLTKAGENFSTTVAVGDIIEVYGGTTAADYGTYIVRTVTSDTVLTLDRNFSATNTDVDFDIIQNAIVIENSRDATAKMILPLDNDAAEPTLSFGKGTTGFYAQQDGILCVAAAAGRAWVFGDGQFSADDAAGPALQNEAATSTNPTLIPNKANPNTGVGWNSTNILSLVVNGAEGLKVDSIGNVVCGTGAGTIIAGNQGQSGAIINETGSTTNPTLIPNRTETDTGWGWASDTLVAVLGGAAAWTFTAASLVGDATNGPQVLDETATTTNPTFSPYGSAGYGLGGSATTVNLIAGGADMVSATSTTVTIATDWSVTQSAIFAANAAGPGMLDETSTTTNPTIIPDKSEFGTGLGGTSNNWSLIRVGVEQLTGSASLITANTELLLTDNFLTRAVLKDYALQGATGSISSGAITYDLTLANAWETTLVENITTITLSNPPASGDLGQIITKNKQDATGGRTVAHPAAVVWVNATAYVASTAANAVDIVVLKTWDGGTIWYGDYSKGYA